MEVLYWAGCFSRQRFQENIDAHFKLLRKLGYSLISLKDEGCCGNPLLLAGDIENAKRTATKTAEHLRNAGVDLIVTGCAGCYKAFREYKNLKINLPKFQHIAQTLAENLNKLKFLNQKEQVTYHDPCELGRLAGEYEAPRKVLKAIATLKEPLANRAEAFCCGGGGLIPSVAPRISVRVAEIRFERDIEPLKLSKLVTTCPACLANLSVGAKTRARKTGQLIEVIDLGKYVYSRLGDKND